VLINKSERVFYLFENQWILQGEAAIHFSSNVLNPKQTVKLFVVSKIEVGS
jgi:hypothetical protein